MAPLPAPREADVDFDALATYLKALANPVRLELLWNLRSPASSGSLLVRPRRRDGLPRGRHVARQTIRTHLRRLGDVGMVRQVPSSGGAAAERMVANVQRIFAIVEEVRKLTAIPVDEPLDPDRTTPLRAPGSPQWPPGPKLVLLNGPWEGHAYPLAQGGPWRVGRSRSNDVALHYDPFVSKHHVRIERMGGAAHALRVEPGARNAGHLNFLPLEPGATRPLHHGDVLGVGRSVLAFRDD